MNGKLLSQVLNKMLVSPAAQDARVQVKTPDGRFFDVQGINLVENKIIGARETHRIVISTHEELAKMGKPIKLL